jgi:hypothetical protein
MLMATLGPTPADLLDEQAKEIALFGAGKAVHRLRVLAVDDRGVQVYGLTGGRQFFGGGDRHVQLVAQAVDLDDRAQRGGLNQGAFDESDHGRE